MNTDLVFDRLHDHLAVFRGMGVVRLAVFGSAARGEASADSDLDVLVRFAPGRKSFDNFMDLKFKLEELFPDTRIDLVLEDCLKAGIRDRILFEARDVA